MRRAGAALLLALVATGAQAKRDDPLAGRVAGRAERCLPGGADARLTILDKDTIVWRQSGRRIWVTHPVGACASLAPDRTLLVESFGGMHCRNDLFRTITPGLSIPSAACRFGSFVPYDKS
jgi:hypothetical protein